MQSQRKNREALVAERDREQQALDLLKSGQVKAQATVKEVENETSPIRYAAQLLGLRSDDAIRWFIALMVLCCDPLAIALTAAAASARR